MFEWTNPSVVLLVISTLSIFAGIFLYRMGSLDDKIQYMYGGLFLSLIGCVMTMCSILFFFKAV